MKTIFLNRLSTRLLLAFFLSTTFTAIGLAQTSTSNHVPVVTIQATDLVGTWTGETASFTLFRSGDPVPPLNIYCCISGTASNGVDYETIGSFVQLAAGVVSNSVVITPINLGQIDVKTVTLDLCPSPLMNPVNYSIGTPGCATVYITPPGVTNLPPSASIVSPTNGEVFYAPANISLIARAGDPDGNVTNVEFYAGTNDLGAGFPVVLDPPGANGVVGLVYFFPWSDVPTNTYSLTAVATDNDGFSTMSSAVKISVRAGTPPTNLPPVVRITSPPNGAVFRAPVDIPLLAYANDRDGLVASVEFFDGTNSLGFGQPVLWHPLTGPAQPVLGPIGFFELSWSNAPVATHQLTAEATDNDGASTLSNPINITILPSPPPPTNRPPVVNIVATDPLAIEGTNCWPWLGLVSPVPTWQAWSAASPVCQIFTNCGPKNATFTVRRFGATNDDLTVAYSVGGTATNGLQYATLPGVVVIPAGERSAMITIVPVDDGPPDVSSTVVLGLIPDTNTPPDYLVGRPRSAAGIILDVPSPRPLAGLLPDKSFHLATTGPDGAWFRIDYSTDLLNWTSICTNQVINGNIDFVDPDAQNTPTRYYRSVPELSPPE